MGQRNVRCIDADRPVLEDEDFVLRPQYPLLNRFRGLVPRYHTLNTLHLQGLLQVEAFEGVRESHADRNVLDLDGARWHGVGPTAALGHVALRSAHGTLPDPEFHLDLAHIRSEIHEPLRPAVRTDGDESMGRRLHLPLARLLRASDPGTDPGDRTRADLDTGKGIDKIQRLLGARDCLGLGGKLRP
jgi:hypothetical protein